MRYFRLTHTWRTQAHYALSHKNTHQQLIRSAPLHSEFAVWSTPPKDPLAAPFEPPSDISGDSSPELQRVREWAESCGLRVQHPRLLMQAFIHPSLAKSSATGRYVCVCVCGSFPGGGGSDVILERRHLGVMLLRWLVGLTRRTQSIAGFGRSSSIADNDVI